MPPPPPSPLPLQPLPVSPPYKNPGTSTFFFPPSSVSTPGDVVRSLASHDDLDALANDDDGSYEDMRPVGYSSDSSSMQTNTPSSSLPRTFHTNTHSLQRAGISHRLYGDVVDTDSFTEPESLACTSRDSSLHTTRTATSNVGSYHRDNDSQDVQGRLEGIVVKMNILANSFGDSDEPEQATSPLPSSSSSSATPNSNHENPLVG